MSDKTETKEVRKRGYEGTRRYDYDIDNAYKGMSKDDWRAMIVEEYEVVAGKANCEWLMFVFHDKDVDGQGLPKPLHVHFLVKYKEARTQSAVMNDFCGTNPRVENCKWVDARKGGYKSLARYMTHHSESAYNKRKTWYHHSDVYAYKCDYLELIKSSESAKVNSKDMKDSAEKLIGEIMKGATTATDALTYFIENHGGLATVEYTSKFEVAERNFAKMKTKELEKRSLNNKWRRTTIYISGAGQSGKTRTAANMANEHANEFGVDIVSGGGGRNITSDLVDGYGNQNASVLDDLESSEFKYRDFYKMFDPNNWSLTKSRNYNKPWFPEWVYITNNTRIETFLVEMLFYSRKTFRSRDGKLKDMSDEDIKALGLIHLNGRDSTLEACRMVARRVKFYMNFEKMDDGKSIVTLMKLVDTLPEYDEIRAYVDNHCDGIYDERLFGLFYNKLAYIPYDNDFIDEDQFEAERQRIAAVANEFYETEKFVNGVVMLKEKPLLTKVQEEIKKDDRKREKRQQKERERIAELERKEKEYDRLKSLKVDEMNLRSQENELLKMIIDKMSKDEIDEIANPFGASILLENLREDVRKVIKN